ncbi:MAG TPA: metallopeptidase TldD-related protein [Gemmatimonadaceae bacterium]|nr:metallopeptidase TldD-related protein [Gemmatimonadaceae bacterium]
MSPIFTRPASLFTPDRFLSADACHDLLARIQRLSTGGGEVSLWISSRWTGNLRWARNEIISAGDTTDHQIRITRSERGASAYMEINRLDDDSIRAALAEIERQMRFENVSQAPYSLRSSEKYLKNNLWSDATFNLDAAARAKLQRQLVEPAIAEKLLAAGYLEVSATGYGAVNSAGLFAYQPGTRAEYSLTVRNATGTGSGWAGVDNLDWRKIDPDKLSAIALDKCKRSADPVAIEPGRYDVILEPQAVAALMFQLVLSLQRRPAEQGIGPWADRPQQARSDGPVGSTAAFGDQGSGGGGGGGGNSKIGQLVLDRRITISADPTDPDMPFLPFSYDGSPNHPVKWIENGVLKELSYDRWYAVQQLNKPDPLNNSLAFRMSGGNTTLEEMIASTDRGLLVTRLANVRLVDLNSLLCTGTTSDGVWLIEHGKITHPVKNFRFRESPLYAFNNLESLGAPVRALMWQPTIVPMAKVHDFSMTSLADAV